MFLSSAIIAAVINNDAAILLLTPLIVGVIRRCYPRQPEPVVPFAFAVLSAAGVAPLVISNPINLIVSEYAGIGFNEYAARLIPIAVAGSVTSYLILRTVFRRQLHAVPGWETRSTSKPSLPVLSQPGKIHLATMVAALGCYPALSYAGAPVWAVAAGSATFGVWLCRHYGIASAGQLAAPVPWEILIFLYCIFIIALGLRNVGLVDRITEFYSVNDSEAQVLVIGIASAVGFALLNNHPMAILNLPPATHEHLMAAIDRRRPWTSPAADRLPRGAAMAQFAEDAGRLHSPIPVRSSGSACYGSGAERVPDHPFARYDTHLRF